MRIPPLAFALECLRHNRARGQRNSSLLRSWSFRARLARQARARLFLGAVPLAPTFSKGESPPIMRAAEQRMGESRKSKQKAESQAEACASFANANAAKPKVKQNGEATANLARKLQPRSGEEFRRSLARIAAAGRASATAEGDSKGGTPLDCSFAYFSAGAEK